MDNQEVGGGSRDKYVGGVPLSEREREREDKYDHVTGVYTCSCVCAWVTVLSGCVQKVPVSCQFNACQNQ